VRVAAGSSPCWNACTRQHAARPGCVRRAQRVHIGRNSMMECNVVMATLGCRHPKVESGISKRHCGPLSTAPTRAVRSPSASWRTWCLWPRQCAADRDSMAGCRLGAAAARRTIPSPWTTRSTVSRKDETRSQGQHRAEWRPHASQHAGARQKDAKRVPEKGSSKWIGPSELDALHGDAQPFGLSSLIGRPA